MAAALRGQGEGWGVAAIMGSTLSAWRERASGKGQVRRQGLSVGFGAGRTFRRLPSRFRRSRLIGPDMLA